MSQTICARGTRRVSHGLDSWSVLIAVLLMGAVTTSLVLADQRAALAAGICDSTYSFDGEGYSTALHPGLYYQGASSNVVIRDAPLCSGDDVEAHFSATWVMIADSDGAGWGQIGFIRNRGYPLRYFSQYWTGNDSTYYTTYSSSINAEIGHQHAFRTYYKPGCACLVSKVDTWQFSQSLFSPYAKWHNGSPWIPEFSGEVLFESSDITGTPSTHTTFTNMGVYTSSGANVGLSCGIMHVENDESRFGFSAPSCTSMDIWTANPDTGGMN